MIREITPALCDGLRDYLGVAGRRFFRDVYKRHGNIGTAVWMNGSIPHPVHFREGMTVRNWMRSSGFCDGWSAQDLDDTWAEAVKITIMEVK